MDHLLDTAETTAVLKVGRSTLYKLHHSGALPGVRIGARRLWRSSDVDRFLAGLSDPNAAHHPDERTP